MKIKVKYGESSPGGKATHEQMVNLGMEWLKLHGVNIEGSVLNIGSRDDPRNYKQYFSKASNHRNLDIVDFENVDIVADITNMPEIPSNSEDCIVSMWTFYQIKEIEKALKEVHRVLKPNGLLLATFTGPGRRWKTVWWPSGKYTKSYSKRFIKVYCKELINPLFNILAWKEYGTKRRGLICTYVKLSPKL